MPRCEQYRPVDNEADKKRTGGLQIAPKQVGEAFYLTSVIEMKYTVSRADSKTTKVALKLKEVANFAMNLNIR